MSLWKPAWTPFRPKLYPRKKLCSLKSPIRMLFLLTKTKRLQHGRVNSLQSNCSKSICSSRPNQARFLIRSSHQKSKLSSNKFYSIPMNKMIWWALGIFSMTKKTSQNHKKNRLKLFRTRQCSSSYSQWVTQSILLNKLWLM
jgi:hypothetical protein